MVIEFDPGIFENIGNANEFGFLFNLCYLDRRYDFFVELSKIQNSPIYQLLSASDKEVISQYYTAYVTESKATDYSISETGNANANAFMLSEARSFFIQPVGIILENSLNDKYFLNALIKNFKKRAKRIKRHMELNFISIVNGGGAENIQHVVNEKLATFTGRSKPPQEFLRLFVLVDSDSEYPGHEKDTRKNLKDLLLGLNIPFHILEKREMENYLPDVVMEAIEGNDEYIEAYMRLTAKQKDYFDIEKGFRDINFEQEKEEIQSLFEGVSAQDIAIFRKRGLIFTNFKSEFPKKFGSEIVTQDNLKQRLAHSTGNTEELEDILDKINALI